MRSEPATTAETPRGAILAVSSDASGSRSTASRITPGSVSVVVVSYNARDQLRSCLRSVQAANAGEVVVVDNASDDGSPEMVRAEFPEVKLVANRDNVGYGAAANLALKRCDTPYVLLLNCDTVVSSGALGAMTRYLDQNPSAAVVGPRLTRTDGSLLRSCYPDPSPLDFLLDVSNLYRVVERVPFLRELSPRTWSHDRRRQVPWVNGAALAIRREALAGVGGFDERFFMYSEETDLCYRLSRAGWEVHYAPVAEVVHVGGASASRRRADMIVEMYASMACFYQLHYPPRRLSQLGILIGVTSAARIVRDSIRLRLTGEPTARARLATDLSAWHRLLRGEWRRRVDGI